MNEPLEHKALKMFELWVNTNPNATRREVIETLQKDTTGESTFAEEYVKVLKGSEWYILPSTLALPLLHFEAPCLYQTGSATPYTVAVK